MALLFTTVCAIWLGPWWLVGVEFLDIAGVLADWNRSDMHLTSGVVVVVRVRGSFKSGVLEWRWPTQAQLTRSDILRNIDVLGRECLWSLVPLSPRGRLVCIPVSGFSIGQSAGPHQLSATRSGNHQL